jgi:hypothetical protein
MCGGTLPIESIRQLVNDPSQNATTTHNKTQIYHKAAIISWRNLQTTNHLIESSRMSELFACIDNNTNSAVACSDGLVVQMGLIAIRLRCSEAAV